MQNAHILTLSCPDRAGIVHAARPRVEPMRPLSALAPILALVSCQPLPEARWRVLVDLASPRGTAALAPGASRLAPLSTRDPRLAAHADGQHGAVEGA